MYKNKTILIIALIAVVNALGYAIVIPILYPYSVKFGLTDFQNGLLFALFSLCQFFSAPVIGRLSDKYGRKPLLTLSILGTTLSFFMAAFAQNALWLFAARALDGLTAGNLPVAAAVISDTLSPKDRVKGFGLLYGSFSFGFVFGPAISAVTVGLSASLPFIVAGIITAIATFLTVIFLPETNKQIGKISHAKLFDFSHLYHALFDKSIGLTLVLSLIYAITFSIYIYAFFPYAAKVIHFTAVQNSVFFVSIGIVGLIVQAFLIGRVTKWFGVKKSFSTALIFVTVAFAGQFLIHSVVAFVLCGLLFALANSFVNPLILTVLSLQTDEKSQGSIQGLNGSYMGIGQILGPIIGGGIASFIITYPFLASASLALVCFILSFQVLKHPRKKEHAF